MGYCCMYQSLAFPDLFLNVCVYGVVLYVSVYSVNVGPQSVCAEWYFV